MTFKPTNVIRDENIQSTATTCSAYKTGAGNKGRDTISLATRVIQIHFFTDVSTCGSSQTGVRRKSCSVAQVSGGRSRRANSLVTRVIKFSTFLTVRRSTIHSGRWVPILPTHLLPHHNSPLHQSGSDLVQGGRGLLAESVLARAMTAVAPNAGLGFNQST